MKSNEKSTEEAQFLKSNTGTRDMVVALGSISGSGKQTIHFNTQTNYIGIPRILFSSITSISPYQITITSLLEIEPKSYMVDPISIRKENI